MPSRSSRRAASGQHVAVYNELFEVEAVSEGLATFFSRWPDLGVSGHHGPPAAVTDFVRARAAPPAGFAGPGAALIRPDLLVTVQRLSGAGGLFFVATFGVFAVRDPLRVATRMFGLTPREAQVLALLLRGFQATEIAQQLGLSEMTVGDYFKRLRVKTGAHTLSGVIARLLGWAGPVERVADAENFR